jgi:hypothetical protein
MDAPPPALPPALPPPPDPGRRLRVGAVFGGVFAAGLVLGIILAGLNVAGAQSTSPSPTTRIGIEAPYGRHGGFGHCGFGPDVLHGEFTTPAPGGGYQTLAVQTGTVTSVSASSIAVKSADGFTRTYSVDDNTLVNAGNNGIADVKAGDTVHITAIVSGGKAGAVDILDVTNIQRLRDRWQPPFSGSPLKPSASP